MDLQTKIQNKVNELCQQTDASGAARLSVCDARHWDQDFWNYRNQIIKAVEKRGYAVESIIDFGVMDIFVTKKFTLT